MATTDPRDIARFAEIIQDALPHAIRETFGGTASLDKLAAGSLPLLVLELGRGHHLHLEVEVTLPGRESRSLFLLMRAEDAQRLFDLESRPDESLSQPDTQLIVLAEFTEGAEALTNALGPILGEHGVPALLRVSGASLEDEENSAVTASASFGNGEALAFAGELTHGSGGMKLIVATVPDLAQTMAGGNVGPAPAFAEPVIQKPPQMPKQAAANTPLSAPPPGPRVTAHPLAFGQLEPPVVPGRAERSVDLILDVALNVRVELGSTSMTVEEVLNLSPGSVVELDRLAGEPVDIVINDRLIARGEVVVVEENFGVRITEIIASRQRTSVAV